MEQRLDSWNLKSIVTNLSNFILFLTSSFFLLLYYSSNFILIHFLPLVSPEFFSPRVMLDPRKTDLTNEHLKAKDLNYSISNKEHLGTNKTPYGRL
jgi:hypothetical protein